MGIGIFDFHIASAFFSSLISPSGFQLVEDFVLGLLHRASEVVSLRAMWMRGRVWTLSSGRRYWQGFLASSGLRAGSGSACLGGVFVPGRRC